MIWCFEGCKCSLGNIFFLFVCFANSGSPWMGIYMYIYIYIIKVSLGFLSSYKLGFSFDYFFLFEQEEGIEVSMSCLFNCK